MLIIMIDLPGKQQLTATATNTSHRYPRQRDQNEYKFTVH